MSDLVGLSIVKKIDIDKTHIDNYVLETEEGTKRTKEKFYREASEQRNAYINNQLQEFQKSKGVLEKGRETNRCGGMKEIELLKTLQGRMLC